LGFWGGAVGRVLEVLEIGKRFLASKPSRG
jgi:hypothetical protein